jgi:hypothetical protein
MAQISDRMGAVLRCVGSVENDEGCGHIFSVWTRLERGQYRCPRCGRRPRADLRNGGSRAVLKVLPRCKRWEVQEACFLVRQQHSRQATLGEFDERWGVE